VIQVMALPITTRDGLADKTRAIELSVLGLLGPAEKWPLFSKAQAPVGFGSCGQDENAGCAEAKLRSHGPGRFGVMISGTVN